MAHPQIATLIGGPGTGKTTELLRILESAKARFGGDPFCLGFASYTKAARMEAASRAADAWGVPADLLAKHGWFKTVHAVCYKQLGIKEGQIIDKNKGSQIWLANALGVDVRVVLDEDTGFSRYDGKSAGSLALRAWDLSRARIEPLRDTLRRLAASGESLSWAEAVQYIRRYEESKRFEDRCDYSDLLARFCGLRFDVEGVYEVDPEGVPPSGVKAWIFDEAQDASALVDRCCRRLAEAEDVRWVYLAGDPFQSIFGFGGSSSDHFLSWPADKKKVMERSWRCPRPVLELGERCLRRMAKGYWDRGISPATHDGEVLSAGGARSACAQLDANRPTLVIARCKYTLDAYRDALVRLRLPHAMMNDSDDTQILRGYRAYWDLEHGEPVAGEDLSCAIKHTPTRSLDGPYLTRGAKASWERADTIKRWDMVRPEDLSAIGMTDALIASIKHGSWSELLPKGEKWRSAALEHGPDLATRPQIRLGTIHSTKGMEADDVVISTQISARVSGGSAFDPAIADEERRVEYVGVTRARRRLIVSHDPSEYSMRLPL
jgi:DNA helicase-2/ATP-dependent DNA helicase PcrA